jgi:signal transduction histidine kinase
MRILPAPFPGDLIPEPFLIVGADGRVVNSNPLARTALSRVGSLLPGSSWNDLLGAEDARRFEALVQTLGPGETATAPFRFGTGEPTVLLRLNVLRLAEGASVTLHPLETSVLPAPLFFGQVDVPLPAVFLPTLTHALKSQLAAARTATFLLTKQYQPAALSKEHRWLAAIGDSLVQATAMLDQVELLDATVLEEPVRAPEPTDVSEWLGRLAEWANQASPGTKVALTCHSAVRGRWWLCTGLVGTAVGCLLSNTLKFAPAGSESSLRATEFADGLEIVVSDQGAGLPDSEVAQLFTPFFRGTNARPTPGCGLGLAIARAAILRLGGTISYRVAPGPRVEFSLRFPAKAER